MVLDGLKIIIPDYYDKSGVLIKGKFTQNKLKQNMKKTKITLSNNSVITVKLSFNTVRKKLWNTNSFLCKNTEGNKVQIITSNIIYIEEVN